jgi:hypothetical protein
MDYNVEMNGRAIAQAISRRLPTSAARVRARVWLYGICGEQSGTSVGFLRVLRFLTQFETRYVGYRWNNLYSADSFCAFCILHVQLLIDKGHVTETYGNDYVL